MATPEQEAFIEEMKKAKPRDVWLELWEARQKIKHLETRSNLKPFVRSSGIFNFPMPETTSPDGEYEPVPNVGGGTPHLEYVREENGRIHIRPYTGPKFEERHDGDNY